MELEKIYKILNYRFQDPELIIKAFTHASYINESNLTEDNERLEFLGDSVISLAITHLLMEKFPDASEGKLSKLRSALVSEKRLCKMAIKLGIGEMILLGKGEEKTGGRRKSSILADTIEAIFGAIYLDAGFTKALEIVKDIFWEEIKNVDLISLDYKSKLQELTQKKFGVLPEYKLVAEKGPSHYKSFRIALFINNKFIAEAKGKTKKEAEQKAAKEALNWLKE